MAVADASFNTVNVSISLGLMVDKILGEPPRLVLLIGTPSITMRGSLLALSEEPPRIRIVDAFPGAPLLEMTETPAVLPAISSWGELTAPLLKSFALITAREPVASDFFTVP